MTWFDERQAFTHHLDHLRPRLTDAIREMSQHTWVQGWCIACKRSTRFRVRIGDQPPQLREGLVCKHCGLTARNRALYFALDAQFPEPAQPRIASLERVSLMHRRLRHRFGHLHGSEYLGPKRDAGRLYLLRRRLVRHQSVTELGYADASFDAIIHSDVLEHVYDHHRALAECRRVLRPGGVLLFTVPFLFNRDRNLLRGRPRADGSLEHFEPAEYHGDGVRGKGIYTFHHYGWELLQNMREAGFDQAQLGVVHAPEWGLIWDHQPALVLRGLVHRSHDDSPGMHST